MKSSRSIWPAHSDRASFIGGNALADGATRRRLRRLGHGELEQDERDARTCREYLGCREEADAAGKLASTLPAVVPTPSAAGKMPKVTLKRVLRADRSPLGVAEDHWATEGLALEPRRGRARGTA